MPFITVNMSNAYDASNNTRYITMKEAEDRAVGILEQFPKAQVYVAQVLKEYTAKVDITVADPADPEPAPETPEA